MHQTIFLFITCQTEIRLRFLKRLSLIKKINIHKHFEFKEDKIEKSVKQEVVKKHVSLPTNLLCAWMRKKNMKGWRNIIILKGIYLFFTHSVHQFRKKLIEILLKFEKHLSVEDYLKRLTEDYKFREESEENKKVDRNHHLLISRLNLSNK